MGRKIITTKQTSPQIQRITPSLSKVTNTSQQQIRTVGNQQQDGALHGVVKTTPATQFVQNSGIVAAHVKGLSTGTQFLTATGQKVQIIAGSQNLGLSIFYNFLLIVFFFFFKFIFEVILLCSWFYVLYIILGQIQSIHLGGGQNILAQNVHSTSSNINAQTANLIGNIQQVQLLTSAGQIITKALPISNATEEKTSEAVKISSPTLKVGSSTVPNISTVRNAITGQQLQMTITKPTGGKTIKNVKMVRGGFVLMLF